jgi:hypothetical protein
MADEIRGLLATVAALDKLGARAISIQEAEQVPRNRHAVVSNPRSTGPALRRLLIGRTDGGRYLTLVIEQTIEPTTWLIVTGWASTAVERRLVSLSQ